MIISYNRKSGTSSKGAVEYVDRDGAKVLVGDPEITKQLIRENTNKLKYRSGIIAFEGKKPSQHIINDVINKFKESTFAGLDEDQYNLLMVEHTDTDNYHIHFVIPRLELTTKKAFNPHYYKEDQTRLLKLQTYLNSKHNLSNPFEAERRTSLKQIDTKCKRDEVKQQIHQVVMENIKNGQIQNRDELIQFLEDADIKVSRKGKDYITVELESEKHRLKGEFYGKDFTDIDKVAEAIAKAEREYRAVTPEQLRELEQELDRLIQHKAESVGQKYPKKEQNYIREFRRGTRESSRDQVVAITSSSNYRNDDRNGIDSSVDTKTTNKRMDSTKEHEIRRRGSEVHTQQKSVPKQRQKNHIHQNKRVDHDTNTTNVRRKAIERAEEEQRLREEARQHRERMYREAREARVELYKSITKNARELREQYAKDSIKSSKEYQDIIRTADTSITRASDVAEQSEHNTQTVERLRGLRNSLAEFGTFFKDTLKDIRQVIKDKYNELVNQFDVIKYKLKDTDALIDELYLKEELTLNDVKQLESSVSSNVTHSMAKEFEDERQQQSRSFGMYR
jgi:hypothetical protein